MAERRKIDFYVYLVMKYTQRGIYKVYSIMERTMEQLLCTSSLLSETLSVS